MKNKLETIFFSHVVLIRLASNEIQNTHLWPCGGEEKNPVQFDQNWLIQGLKRFHRYCYILCVAAVMVCYVLQRARAVCCCVDHNFSFKESQLVVHKKYQVVKSAGLD